MITYFLHNSPDGGFSIKSSNGWWIPSDPDNTDYQEYLKWCAEGNSPQEAE